MAYALTLRESLLAISPEASFYIFLADAAIDDSDVAKLTIPVEQIAIPNLDDMAFRYTLIEFSTAVKPFCFLHLMEERAYDAAIYLDPDIQVFAPLTEVEDAFKAGASCVLTPHLLAPLTDAKRPSNLDILRSGTFNLGFAGFSDQPESRCFLEWWGDQLEFDCYNRIEDGLFVDQKFVEFAPSFLPHLYILHHPGYNVAYWNLANRALVRQGSAWTANDLPLVFFHFSGVVPDDPSVFSKHQDRFTIDQINGVASLHSSYLNLLRRNGHMDFQAIPYAYGTFATGEGIPPVMRRGSPELPSKPSTFSDARWNEWNQPSELIDQSRGYTITRLMMAYYNSRPDLMRAFPLSRKSGRKKYHDWFLANARHEAKVPLHALDAAKAEEKLWQSAFRGMKHWVRSLIRR